MKHVALLTTLLALSACATPETRLRSGLYDAGLSNRQASCMARDMAHRLSLGQLMRISSLGNLHDKRMADMTMREFLHNIRSLEDPEILAITSKAALGCAILG